MGHVRSVSVQLAAFRFTSKIRNLPFLSRFTLSSSLLFNARPSGVYRVEKRHAIVHANSLCLPVAVLSLEATSNSLIVLRLSIKTNLRLIAGKRDWTLLVARHAARVEQASPEEDPTSRVSTLSYTLNTTAHTS
jgi:hypothetical protein